MSDSFPQSSSEQPDYTFESWAHVTLKSHHPDPSSQVFNAEKHCIVQSETVEAFPV